MPSQPPESAVRGLLSDTDTSTTPTLTPTPNPKSNPTTIYSRRTTPTINIILYTVLITLMIYSTTCQAFSTCSQQMLSRRIYTKVKDLRTTYRPYQVATRARNKPFLHLSPLSNNEYETGKDSSWSSLHTYSKKSESLLSSHEIKSSKYIPLHRFSRLSPLYSTSSPNKTPSTIQSTPYHTTTTTNDQSPSTSSSSTQQQQQTLSGYKAPSVNWYPGHIAKAERNLAETLKSADVLVEVRDARIPKATSHPKVREWIAGKPRIVVLTRVDMVPRLSVRKWTESFDLFGASRWDDVIMDGNVRHQIHQNQQQQKGVGKGKGDGNGKDSQSEGIINIKGNEVEGIVEDVIYVDAKHGRGIPSLHRSIVKAGTYVNTRRTSRGLRQRPLRVAILGYPNVGKSALINRILGRKRAKSANTPGITRSLQWIRVRSTGSGGVESSTDVHGRAKIVKGNPNKGGKKSGGGGGGSGADYELLDSPGIIPANMENQEDAVLLAICNSIGNGAYDNQGVAAYLCERLKTLCLMGREGDCCPHWQRKSLERYGFDPLEPIPVPSLTGEKEMRVPTGEDMLFKVAENTCRGDPENAARKILQDFRSGRMGPMALQLAPEADNDGEVDVRRDVQILGEAPLVMEGEDIYGSINALNSKEQTQQERAKVALQVAKEKGLELPPMVTALDDTNENKDESVSVDNGDSSSSTDDEMNVGKGMFDGW